MKDLISHIAKSLVDNSDEVVVVEVEGEKTTVLELKVAQSDLGKIIGKQGRTARAMRLILNAAAAKIKKRAVLEIIEPEGSRRPRRQPEREDQGQRHDDDQSSFDRGDQSESRDSIDDGVEV